MTTTNEITAKVLRMNEEFEYSTRLEKTYSAAISIDAWTEDSPETVTVWVVYGVPGSQQGSHDAAFGRDADPMDAWCSWRIMDEGIAWSDVPGSDDVDFRRAIASAIETACADWQAA